jgi:hypothetical protein
MGNAENLPDVSSLAFALGTSTTETMPDVTTPAFAIGTSTTETLPNVSHLVFAIGTSTVETLPNVAHLIVAIQTFFGEVLEFPRIKVTLTSRGELTDYDGFPAVYHWPPHITTTIGTPGGNANDITVVYDYSGGSANWIEEEAIGIGDTDEGLGQDEESNMIPSEIAWTYNIRRVRWNGVTTQWMTPIS